MRGTERGDDEMSQCMDDLPQPSDFVRERDGERERGREGKDLAEVRG